MSNKRKHNDNTDNDDKDKSNKRVASKNFLYAATLQDIIRTEPFRFVVQLDHNESVSVALNKLAYENIVSAPVVLSASLEDSDMGTYLGMFDFGVVLKSLLTLLDEKKINADDNHISKRIFKKVGSELMNKKLIQVCGNDMGLVYQASMNGSVYDLLHNVFLQDNGHHVHRVAIFDGYGKPTAIISQSDVVRYIHKEIGFVDGRNRTLEDLNDLGTNKVICIDHKKTALQAFNKMRVHNVRCLCVVKNKKAIDSISTSDLRNCTEENLDRLLKKVTQFKSDTSRPLITVEKKTRLKDLLKVFYKTGVHEVYIVNKKQEPIRIITLTDIIRKVAGS